LWPPRLESYFPIQQTRRAPCAEVAARLAYRRRSAEAARLPAGPLRRVPGWRSSDQAYFLTALLIAPAALAKSSGTMTG